MHHGGFRSCNNAPHQFVDLKNVIHPMSALDLYAFMFIHDAQMPQHFGDFFREFIAFKDLKLTSLCDLFGISYVTPQAVQ